MFYFKAPEIIQVICDPKSLHITQTELNKTYPILCSRLVYLPKEKEVVQGEAAFLVEQLVNQLQEHEEVQTVFINCELQL